MTYSPRLYMPIARPCSYFCGSLHRFYHCQRRNFTTYYFLFYGSIALFQALSHSSSSQPSGLEHVAQACRGIVFLGAAHRETLRENFGQIAAKAAAAVQPSLEIKILRNLEERSTTFDAVNESFLKFLEKRGKTFKSITFYEKCCKGKVSSVCPFLIVSHFIFNRSRLSMNLRAWIIGIMTC